MPLLPCLNGSSALLALCCGFIDLPNNLTINVWGIHTPDEIQRSDWRVAGGSHSSVLRLWRPWRLSRLWRDGGGSLILATPLRMLFLHSSERAFVCCSFLSCMFVRQGGPICFGGGSLARSTCLLGMHGGQVVTCRMVVAVGLEVVLCGGQSAHS